VTNAAPAILGADNKAAVAAMLDAIRVVVQEGRPHAGVELVLTVQEEVGLLGAKAFDAARLHARVGFVYDHAAPVGEVIAAGPTQYTIGATFHGHASHSGIAPEQGRSAIAAAARAIAEMRLGRIDDESTANVGLIRGGTARNIVPAECSLLAEVRSLDSGKARRMAQEMVDAMAHAANLEECSVDTTVTHEYEAYRLRRGDVALTLAGGADSHVFNARGLSCACLANGMASVHTADEHIAVGDVEGMARVTLALIEAARARPDAVEPQAATGLRTQVVE
jgi:tripeptide aminopeptidase